MDNGAISSPTDRATAAPIERAIGESNLFRLELSSIVKRVKGISKGMLADRTEVTLAPLW